MISLAVFTVDDLLTLFTNWVWYFWTWPYYAITPLLGTGWGTLGTLLYWCLAPVAYFYYENQAAKS